MDYPNQENHRKKLLKKLENSGFIKKEDSKSLSISLREMLEEDIRRKDEVIDKLLLETEADDEVLLELLNKLHPI